MHACIPEKKKREKRRTDERTDGQTDGRKEGRKAGRKGEVAVENQRNRERHKRGWNDERGKMCVRRAKGSRDKDEKERARKMKTGRRAAMDF